MTEMTKTTRAFQEGDAVRKVSGDYQLVGVVVGVVTTLADHRRYVVEHAPVAPGLLHIYSAANLEPEVLEDSDAIGPLRDQGIAIAGEVSSSMTIDALEGVLARNAEVLQLIEDEAPRMFERLRALIGCRLRRLNEDAGSQPELC